MTFKKTLIPFLLIAVTFYAASCNKNKETARMSVKMTDQPGDFDTVNVEVLEVQLNYTNEDDESNWVVLETVAGNYDLLLLQDGLTAKLSDDVEIPVGQLGQMRLILGTNNYVIVDSVYHPLDLSSQDKTGLKFNLNTEVAADDEIEIVFDFDAHASIVLTGAGVYKLKPVLKVEEIIYL